MRRVNVIKLLFLIVILCTALVHSSVAQQSFTCYDIAGNIGSSGTVCGKIKGVSVSTDSSATLLYLCAPFPHQALTVVLENIVVPKLKSSPNLWDEKQICITGIIGLSNGKPQMIVSNRNQITLR